MTQQAKLIECHPVFHNITLLIKNFIPADHLPIHRRDSSNENIFQKYEIVTSPPPIYDNFISLILLFCIFLYVRTLKYQKYQISMYNQTIGHQHGIQVHRHDHISTPKLSVTSSTKYYKYVIRLLFLCVGGVSTELHTVETSTSSYRVK